jgi:LPXTG-motif cell wall-anchored protein
MSFARARARAGRRTLLRALAALVPLVLVGAGLVPAVAAPAQAASAGAARTASIRDGAPGDIRPLAAGVPEGPVTVWTESFDDVTGTAPLTLAQYPSAATFRYTASTFWGSAPNCNGVLLRYDSSFTGTTALCDADTATVDALTQRQARRLADVLGQLNAGVTGGATDTAPAVGSTATTRANRATAELSMTGTATTAQTVVLEARAGATLNPAPTTNRYYAVSLDVSEDSCPLRPGGANNNSRLDVALLVGGTTRALTTAPIIACNVTGGRYNSPLINTAESQTANYGSTLAVRAGRFTTDTAVQLTPSEAAGARIRIANQVLASAGNDFALDNLRLLDVTPSLDLAFGPSTVTAGNPTTLTFTVTNTAELAAKPDWSFTNALPSGLVVAPTPAVGGSCTSSTGAAYSVQAAAGATSIAVTGGDLATGATSCTVTVNVVAANAGSYTNGPANVTTALVAPDSATLTVEAPATITIRKNVAGRALAADQFRLALSLGGTEVAAATTTGSATGIQNVQLGPLPVTRGQTYTISETVVTSASLSTYTTGYECSRGGVTIATGSSVSGSITIPDEAGATVECTFTNTPQVARLYCDGTYFYALRANGSIAQVNGSGTGSVSQILGAVAGTTDANALGINNDGTVAFALDRDAGASNVTAVLRYTASASGGLQATRTALTAAEGTLQDRNGAAVAGTIIAGAVNPLTGRFLVGKSTAGSVRLWEYNPDTPGASDFLYLGQVATGTTAGENGDISFDAAGNLHIVQTPSDSSSVGLFTVTQQALSQASGGTLAASATVRRALSGTDANNALTGVNGMAFSPRGTVYLGNGTLAYQFDPTTWVRVPGSPRASINSVTPASGSTDLAGCATPATISIKKNLVGSRISTTDQFRLALSTGSPAVESAIATTSGTATGLQAARVGPVPVQIDTTVTIAETMAAGSLSPLTSYTTVYECWAEGVRIANGTDRSTSVRIPNRLSVGVACTFFNTPQPFATVRVTKIVEDNSGGNRTPTPGWTVGTTVQANTGSTVTALPSRNPEQQTGADGSASWRLLFGAATHRGRVTVTETEQPGFRYESLVCTVNGANATVSVTTVAGVVRATVNADLAPGNAVECTFTNRPSASLTLVATVSYGSALPSDWRLSATGPTGSLPGPAGASGTPAASGVRVTPGVAYRLASSGGSATYVQTGAWQCSDAAGQSVPVSATSDVTLAAGAAVTCTVGFATASLTLLKQVENPRPGFQVSDWRLTAAPAALAGTTLPTESRIGAAYVAAGNPANTFDVRPGHGYTLSETTTDPNSRVAYRQLRLERLVGSTWTPVDSAAITAPAAGQSAVYRFVNAPVQPPALPLTGGTSADAYLYAGGALLILALLGGVLHARRRREPALQEAGP